MQEEKSRANVFRRQWFRADAAMYTWTWPRRVQFSSLPFKILTLIKNIDSLKLIRLGGFCSLGNEDHGGSNKDGEKYWILGTF